MSSPGASPHVTALVSFKLCCYHSPGTQYISWCTSERDTRPRAAHEFPSIRSHEFRFPHTLHTSVRDGAIEIGSGRAVGPISESHGEIGAAVGPVSVIQKFSLRRLWRRNRRPLRLKRTTVKYGVLRIGVDRSKRKRRMPHTDAPKAKRGSRVAQSGMKLYYGARRLLPVRDAIGW